MSNEGQWGSLRPVVPDGTHLAYATDDSGDYRALLFEDGTNRLIGPPKLVRVDDDDDYNSTYEEESPRADSQDDDDSPSWGEMAVSAAIAIGSVVAKAAAPSVKAWWEQKALPGVKKKWPRLES